jgi:spore coat protein H
MSLNPIRMFAVHCRVIRTPRAALCLIAWLWAAVVPGAAADARPDANTFFGLTNLWDIHLTIPREEWRRMQGRGGPSPLVQFFGDGQAKAIPSRGSSDYPWAAGTVQIAGQVITNVALRFKGNSSFVRAPNAWKRPFKLDFNRLVKGRKLGGIEELVLNNNVNDATQMREALAYDLFRRAGIPAPRTAFARVSLTITGQFEKRVLGLYTVIEPVEGEFLKRTLGTGDGLLLKPEMMQGVEYLGDDWDAYVERYDPKAGDTPKARKNFIRFVRAVAEGDDDTFDEQVIQRIDPAQFLRFVALNSILANMDSFIGNGHNYYLHQHPQTARIDFIPWDLNEAFGMHPVSGPSGSQLKFSVTRPNADPNELIQRLLRTDRWNRLYRAECAALLTNVFEPARLAGEIDRIAAITQPIVFAETSRAKEDFQRTVLGTLAPDDGDTEQPRFDQEHRRESYRPREFPGLHIDNMPLKTWIEGRHAHVLKQLEGRTRGTTPRARQ